MESKFMGYRRENGRVGVRNHVIILPLDDLSNSACEAVANNVKGTMAIPHPYGRLQFGEDLELHFRTLIGTGCNPNVAAVIVIGIEPQWTDRIVQGIAKTGKPVTGFAIEQNGDFNTICAASKKAKEYMHQVSEYQRVECDVSELWVSTK
ncbi:MAG: D-galactarate dehydratase, partial [Desulfofustis sp.]|nr:D-galactarate dehydratase [Desulfofustis sp.]